LWSKAAALGGVLLGSFGPGTARAEGALMGMERHRIAMLIEKASEELEL
jgi:hypothetical protein